MALDTADSIALQHAVSVAVTLEVDEQLAFIEALYDRTFTEVQRTPPMPRA